MQLRHAVLFSLALHGVIILLLITGLPFFSKKHPEVMMSIPVEAVDISERSMSPAPVPKPAPQPKPEEPKVEPKKLPEPKTEPQKVEPKPESGAEKETPSEPDDAKPEAKPEPIKDKEVVPLPEKPKENKPQPVEDPKPKPEVKKKKDLPKKTDKKKEQKKKNQTKFNSLLKNLESMKSSAENEKQDEDQDSSAQGGEGGEKVTMSEMDALKRQLASCWSIAAGAKNAEDLSVDIKIWVNPDATVRDAKIVDTGRLSSDPFFRAAAESALRAVLSPQCSPLKLPLEKYNSWKVLVIGFNPREMLTP